MKLYAKDGIAIFAVVLLAAYLQARHHGSSSGIAGSVWAGGAALVALLVGQIIGGAINRPRPYESMANVHVLIDRTTDFSFPSDHATAVGAVAVGVLLVNRGLGIAAMVLAFVMAFARVYVDAHYPADVLSGLVLGGAVALAGYFTVAPVLARLVNRLGASRAGWLVRR